MAKISKIKKKTSVTKDLKFDQESDLEKSDKKETRKYKIAKPKPVENDSSEIKNSKNKLNKRLVSSQVTKSTKKRNVSSSDFSEEPPSQGMLDSFYGLVNRNKGYLLANFASAIVAAFFSFFWVLHVSASSIDRPKEIGTLDLTGEDYTRKSLIDEDLFSLQGVDIALALEEEIGQGQRFVHVSENFLYCNNPIPFELMVEEQDSIAQLVNTYGVMQSKVNQRRADEDCYHDCNEKKRVMAVSVDDNYRFFDDYTYWIGYDIFAQEFWEYTQNICSDIAHMKSFEQVTVATYIDQKRNPLEDGNTVLYVQGDGLSGRSEGVYEIGYWNHNYLSARLINGFSGLVGNGEVADPVVLHGKNEDGKYEHRFLLDGKPFCTLDNCRFIFDNPISLVSRSEIGNSLSESTIPFHFLFVDESSVQNIRYRLDESIGSTEFAWRTIVGGLMYENFDFRYLLQEEVDVLRRQFEAQFNTPAEATEIFFSVDQPYATSLTSCQAKLPEIDQLQSFENCQAREGDSWRVNYECNYRCEVNQSEVQEEAEELNEE